MRTLRQMLLTLSIAGLLTVTAGHAAVAAVPENTHLLLYPGSSTVYVNGSKSETDVGLAERSGRYYLPAAKLQDWFGVPVKWNGEKGAVQLTTPSAFVEVLLPGQELLVNGISQKQNTAVLVEKDRLYFELKWLEQYISFRSNVDSKLQRVELRYIKPADSALFQNDTLPNMKPVAKFSVDKDSYRIGEPIRYSNLSYDPKGTGLTEIEWTGNAEAIFTPGLYKVSLQVKDGVGNYSDTFSRNVLVKDEPFLDEFEYKVYHEPVGTYVHEEEAVLRKYLRDIPQLPLEEHKPTDRPLIVSDSPETFTEKGILYQEKVNGKARLYADHVNGSGKKMKLAILVRNPNPDRSVTIKTTNKGEVYPSIYANLIGNEATIEFLQGEQAPQSMVLRPQETAYYKMYPGFYPDQGMNIMYDVETDGDVYFSFVAMEPDDEISDVSLYPQMPYKGNVRGTFTGSEVQWKVDASKFRKPSSFQLGDGTSDRFVTGYDFFEKRPALNLGNYGVVYNIHVERPQAMSVLILPRGGVFKGPFKVNGKIVQTPPSGVMTDYTGYTIIARTNGTEPSLDIAFSPAAGSAFPIDIIFYPMDRK
ncbi:stalk domain-containing protein [Paenibacillus allorhizosphaerae]|uniref:Copper amine oxidase-like N-terminal domain-containing protein n=1 Tax=Paenibacillus allorhizosphaerae TaxID=2849866 RepID=A0ABM8VBE6_9BACL|nr:stalk domain-containing protein [Paenibacillus allorhizosphaerae]CAG7619297.1 hypothetical protein PAECIP111802_00606 [Paenibacillus allorhizosphaerae]